LFQRGELGRKALQVVASAGEEGGKKGIINPTKKIKEKKEVKKPKKNKKEKKPPNGPEI